jgi:hypothetical protein
MAGLEQRSGRYRVFFRYHGKQHTLPLGKVSRDEAEAKSSQVDYLLMRLLDLGRTRRRTLWQA